MVERNVIFGKEHAGHQPELIEEKVRRVEEFAELGPTDRPFKTLKWYASRSRLAYQWLIDLYLIDEVTSAGDERFRSVHCFENRINVPIS